MDFLVPESFNRFIALLLGHLGEHDVRLELCLAKQLVDSLSEVLRVHEDESLGRFARLENFLDEVQLFALLTLHPKLLDVIQLQLFRLDFDLLRFADDLALSLLHELVPGLVLGLVRSRKENPLQVLIALNLFLGRNLLERLMILVVEEEHVGLVHDYALQLGQVQRLSS